MLEPITRTGLVDDVYLRIRHAIIDGTLPPGERLVEDLLANQLGVSRAPIRDALKALERDGLVASAGKRGKIVTLISARDAWEVYSLRSTLEAMAIGLAMEATHPGLVDELQAIVEEMKPASVAGNHEALSVLDVKFHEAICRTSHHDRLLSTWEGMSIQIRRLSQQVIDTHHSDLLDIPARHELIVEAIRAGDPQVAQQRIRHHIDSVADRVIRVLDETELHPKSAVEASARMQSPKGAS